MFVQGMTSVERNPLLPILKIQVSCQENIQPVLLREIVSYAEIAEEFGGRLMDSEQHLQLNRHEKIAVAVQIIFQDEEMLNSFRDKVKL